MAVSFTIEIVDPRKETRACLGDLTFRAEGGSLVISYDCDDCYYSFERPIHLGRLLSALGLTAADCERAIAGWGRPHAPAT